MAKKFMLLAVVSLALLSLHGGFALSRDYPLFGSYLHYEMFEFFFPNIQELVESPLVVVGKVKDIKHTGNDHFGKRVDPEFAEFGGEAEIEVFEASVSVEQVLKGRLEGTEILVETCVHFGDSMNHSCQPLATEKRFVFFLKPGKDNGPWVGVHPIGFALRIESPLALGEKSDLPLREKLRVIAYDNIRDADEPCAARWFELLTEKYNPDNGQKICLEMMDDSRPRIRGQALAILCQHHPETVGLYEKAWNYAVDVALPWGCPRGWVASRLYPVLAHHKPESIDDELRKWLQHFDRGVHKAALEAIGKERRTNMMSDVVDHLAKLESQWRMEIGYLQQLEEHKQKKRIQGYDLDRYDCYKALCKIKRINRVGTGLFREEPESYLEEFRRYGTKSDNSSKSVPSNAQP